MQKHKNEIQISNNQYIAHRKTPENTLHRH